LFWQILWRNGITRFEGRLCLPSNPNQGVVKNPLAGFGQQQSPFERERQGPKPDWFCVVFTQFEGRLCLPSNSNQSGKK
jgi:hypothetical protein